MKMLPTVKIAGMDVSRLIIGGNPFCGNSHHSQAMNKAMLDYYTMENIKRALHRCHELGVNTFQVRGDSHMAAMVRELRAEGNPMQWIAQNAPEIQPFEGNVASIARNGAEGIYHHGTLTDALFKAGDLDTIAARLAVIRKTGKATGLCTHMPEVVLKAESLKWDVDFYMLSLYNLSRQDRESSFITGKANLDEDFFEEDRALAYEVIKAVKKPFLVFKILGASRRCDSPAAVRETFAETFANIKDTDPVVVGMFPKTTDQIYDNVRTVADILA